MDRKGLGKGLDSLIPNIFDENFDSNSAQSLEDMMKEEESVEDVIEDIESKEGESKSQDDSKEVNEEESKTEDVKDDVSNVEEDVDDSQDVDGTDKDVPIQEDKQSDEPEVDDSASEELPSDKSSEESVQTSPEIQVQKEHVDEVIAIVDKNPRITLWSSRSSAVFRYLRKTEPEFSISKEASILIEEAVAKKYPEIWALFEDL